MGRTLRGGLLLELRRPPGNSLSLGSRKSVEATQVYARPFDLGYLAVDSGAASFARNDLFF
jgi:hypothetical protein